MCARLAGLSAMMPRPAYRCRTMIGRARGRCAMSYGRRLAKSSDRAEAQTLVAAQLAHDACITTFIRS